MFLCTGRHQSHTSGFSFGSVKQLIQRIDRFVSQYNEKLQTIYVDRFC
jgi:hypothetical protein